MTSQHPAGPPPAMHPMDPRRGRDLSPMFAAFLGWLLGLEPMTSPAITGIAVSGNCVLAATDQNPLFDQHLGSLDDFEANIRGWGAACGADAGMVESLVARMRGTDRRLMDACCTRAAERRNAPKPATAPA